MQVPLRTLLDLVIIIKVIPTTIIIVVIIITIIIVIVIILIGALLGLHVRLRAGGLRVGCGRVRAWVLGFRV